MSFVIESFTGPFAFLSNFSLDPVEFEGIVYPSVEHAYQAAKTTDAKTRSLFAQNMTPGQAKRFGQKVTLRHDWEKIKVSVMSNLVAAKFKNLDLAKKLAATGDAPLVEGNNWHDNFWGDCYCGRSACEKRGENFLGKILEGVRTMNEMESK